MDISLAVLQYPQPAMYVGFIHTRHKMAAASKGVCLNSRQGKDRRASRRLPPGEASTFDLERHAFPKDYFCIIMARTISHGHSYCKRGWVSKYVGENIVIQTKAKCAGVLVRKKRSVILGRQLTPSLVLALRKSPLLCSIPS